MLIDLTRKRNERARIERMERRCLATKYLLDIVELAQVGADLNRIVNTMEQANAVRIGADGILELRYGAAWRPHWELDLANSHDPAAVTQAVQAMGLGISRKLPQGE